MSGVRGQRLGAAVLLRRRARSPTSSSRPLRWHCARTVRAVSRGRTSSRRWAWRTRSAIDPTPLHPFGHGLSYTTFGWEPGEPVPAEIRTDGSADIEVTVRNTGDREGAEVVQLYVHDPVAQTTRPQAQLIGYARVELAAGQARKVRFRFHADLVSFTGIGGRRIVEPGDLELRLAASSAVRDIRQTVRLRLTGPERTVDHRRRLVCETTVEEAAQFPAAAGN